MAEAMPFQSVMLGTAEADGPFRAGAVAPS